MWAGTSGKAGAPRATQRDGRATRVLVADDQGICREGVRALLEREDDIHVVGEARDGLEAVSLTARLRPDVVVMEIGLPRLNGFASLRRIRRKVPHARVVVLTSRIGRDYVDRALSLGAAGYLLKDASPEEFAEAVRTASAEAPVVDDVDCWGASRPTAPSGTAERPCLTARETTVLRAIAGSDCNESIARRLRISVKTVEKHRQGVMDKLDIHDVAGLTRYAVATGLVESVVRRSGA